MGGDLVRFRDIVARYCGTGTRAACERDRGGGRREQFRHLLQLRRGLGILVGVEPELLSLTPIQAQQAAEAVQGQACGAAVDTHKKSAGCLLRQTQQGGGRAQMQTRRITEGDLDALQVEPFHTVQFIVVGLC